MPSTETTVPAGYRQNSKGHLVPETMIKPVDILIDDLINTMAGQWKLQKETLAEFKRRSFEEVHALVAAINEQYGVKKGGEKGNIQLFSYDGTYKLIVAVAETITFGPELQAAREMINECLNSWTSDAQPELRTIINEAFATDGQGSVSVARILMLRRYNITDERWLKALAAINDAVRVMGSKQYMRLYERNEAGAYLPISLDIAAL
jgi:hypothetical protein